MFNNDYHFTPKCYVTISINYFLVTLSGKIDSS